MKTKKSAKKPERRKLLTNGPNGSKPAFQDIATAAYFNWEKNGRPEGHAVDDWLQAERQLAASGDVDDWVLGKRQLEAHGIEG